MRRPAPGPAQRGSQKWLQQLVNERPDVLASALCPELGLPMDTPITWLSPLRSESYAEYCDQEFISQLGTPLEKRILDSFWPAGGPVWDGLGRTDRGDLLLVEAKAHIAEMVSPGSRAGEASLERIRQSLEETRKFLHGRPVDWSGTFYQYANRLAHLYLLRELNGLPAWLVFVHFVGDTDMQGPATRQEWEGAIRLLHAYLGLGRTRLSPYIIDLFVGGGKDSCKIHTLSRIRREAPESGTPATVPAARVSDWG